MWFGALAPTISHALASANVTAWAEVCTPQGMRWVSLADDVAAEPATPNSNPAGMLDHCPFCTLNSQGSAPPPVVATPPLIAAENLGPPERFLSAARTAHAWCAAQPRAPPFHS